VQSQSCIRWELIVVDDGSTDDTVRIVSATAPEALITATNRAGVCAARNHGLALAKGDFVCFLDQDDFWYPEHLSRHLSVLDAHPQYGAVFGPYRFWYPNQPAEADPEALLAAPPDSAIDHSMEGWLYHQFLMDCWALTSATTLRRQLLQDSGAFDESRTFAEDWELWLRLSQHTQFARLSWPPVLYRQHSTQGSRLVRTFDHRSRLLEDAVKRWGFRSRDGQSVDASAFRRQLAGYEAGFGRSHLQRGSRWLGVRTLLRAWARAPRSGRWLALALAGAVGYRPGDDEVDMSAHE
jgi:GT2 family glycosyltransferase